MTCPVCRAETYVKITQSKRGRHRLPKSLAKSNVLRRRRVCLMDFAHQFWTLELCEDEISERRLINVGDL